MATTPEQLITILSRHIGKGNGIGVKELAESLQTQPRNVRSLISYLRDDGHAICGTPKDGYFMAATAAELEETCAFIRKRAMHSLCLESRLRKIPMADLLGQLHVPT